MTTLIASDNAIIEVNNALNTVLSQYLNTNGNKIDIRFDLPEINSIQSEPTVSVFLYDINEDLQLRSAEPRRYNPITSTLLPGWVNINCNYLITYWDANKPSSDSSSPDSQPNNQAAQVMTRVLNALINNRQLTGIPGAYTRIIPQQENLNSLGNFWQALGNRPRLSLMYSITVPMKLQDIKDNITPISQISASVVQKPSLNNSQINQALTDKLCADLGGIEADTFTSKNIKVSGYNRKNINDN
uniref:Orf6 n=1 Tax=Photorhabdus luminescens TaxID=29488 RepID=Q8GDL5_PHOLU|nr:Orf6 [Photorhabdus luminescens]